MTEKPKFEPGEHFHERQASELRRRGPGIWITLGYERTLWEPGRQIIEWKATEDYGFPTASGYIVHGGMVSTLLDSAMGGAAWTLLNNDEVFLTSNLNVEFHRATRPGLLRAEGEVVSRTKRTVFCTAAVYDEEGRHTASGRCTQIILSSDGPAARAWQKKEQAEED